ncbi:hypothetical protein [Streptomyces noursei]|uniref:hypothetical protein n=1 Tax=Streptomyces noursei TaxID=1971 RepID=UPI00382AF452
MARRRHLEIIQAACTLPPNPEQSITSIAKLLGVSPGAFYNHIPDLQELREAGRATLPAQSEAGAPCPVQMLPRASGGGRYLDADGLPLRGSAASYLAGLEFTDLGDAYGIPAGTINFRPEPGGRAPGSTSHWPLRDRDGDPGTPSRARRYETSWIRW